LLVLLRSGDDIAGEFNVGNPADFIVLDNADKAKTVAELSQPLTGFKRGRRPAATLCRPDS
jgi:cytosine/adenosine deaminase-related metal-dependent hydrolase